MLFLEGTLDISRIEMTNAVAADAATIAVLQKGGFVYLTYNYSATKPFVAPVATLADEAGSNALSKKLVYPVFIARPAPGTPRTDFNPINSKGLITVIKSHGFEAMVNSDSYYQDGATYPDIAAGDALKIINNTASSDRPKLVVDTSGAGTFETTVAYALTPVIEGKVLILWL